MLRSKGLSEKVLLLGIDGLDPKFSRKMVDEGHMPNLKKLIEAGSARHDLRLLGGVPTITPPMWTTLCTEIIARKFLYYLYFYKIFFQET